MTKAARNSEAACRKYDNDGRLGQTDHHHFAANENVSMGIL
jgi:hypothetical protein